MLRRRNGLLPITEKQIEAYLITRDTLRHPHFDVGRSRGGRPVNMDRPRRRGLRKRLQKMSELLLKAPAPTKLAKSIFTILGGTTIPDRAAIIRADCRENSRVELRRRDDLDAGCTRVDVWVECKSLLGLMKAWKNIGHVPHEVAKELLAGTDRRSTVVGYGTVKTVYAPEGRDEAVVTVEIGPQAPV